MEGIDIQAIVRQAIREFIAMENTPTEPGWKAELREEIMHREQLERRVNELVTANRETMRARAADQLRSAVACELRWHGVEDVGLYGPAIEREVITAGARNLVLERRERNAAIAQTWKDFLAWHRETRVENLRRFR